MNSSSKAWSLLRKPGRATVLQNQEAYITPSQVALHIKNCIENIQVDPVFKKEMKEQLRDKRGKTEDPSLSLPFTKDKLKVVIQSLKDMKNCCSEWYIS